MIQRKVLEASFVRHEPPPDHEVKKKGRHGRLFLLLLLFIMAAGITVWVRYTQKQHMKEILIRQQLSQLRNAVMLYHTKRGRLPSDLKSLIDAEFIDPKTGTKIVLVEGVGLDEEGRVVDPMGIPFLYDRSSGTVKSDSSCCKNW